MRIACFEYSTRARKSYQAPVVKIKGISYGG